MISQSSQQVTTAEQLFAMPSDENRYELVEGVMKMMSPAGNEHGKFANRIAYLLSKHVYELDLGEVYAAETGFLIVEDPDTVRAPDVAFVSHVRLSQVKPTRSYLPLAPDLVVEVISPNDRYSEVEAKARQWLAAGTKVVLVADPENLTIKAYLSDSVIRTYESGDTFSTDVGCSGWELRVDEAFNIKN